MLCISHLCEVRYDIFTVVIPTLVQKNWLWIIVTKCHVSYLRVINEIKDYLLIGLKFLLYYIRPRNQKFLVWTIEIVQETINFRITFK